MGRLEPRHARSSGVAALSAPFTTARRYPKSFTICCQPSMIKYGR